MPNIALRVVVIAGLLWSGGYCAAKTLYVDVNGPNDPGTGSYQDPFRRIQEAIDLSDNNDMVIVAKGRYYENIRIDTNNIVLTSTDPNAPDVVAKTIVDGNNTGSVVTFTGVEGPEMVLSGFTITNGRANYGGGIYCLNNSRPVITNCTVSGNTATGYGGGIYCFNDSNSIITNCIIAGNSADYGGGIACVLAGPVIGNCAIINNSASYGGGIVCVASDPIISNCTITNNTVVNDGNSLACNSSQQQYPSNVQVINCILWNGGEEIWNNDGSTITVSYSNIDGGWTGYGNIDAEPLLEMDGYHLKVDSPCKGMADPLGDYNDQTDIDGEPRVIGIYVDMGCDEFLMVGDLDYDEYVNWIDLAIFDLHWLQTADGQAADFDHDGIVNFADFADLAENWFYQQQ